MYWCNKQWPKIGGTENGTCGARLNIKPTREFVEIIQNLGIGETVEFSGECWITFASDTECHDCMLEAHIILLLDYLDKRQEWNFKKANDENSQAAHDRACFINFGEFEKRAMVNYCK